MRGDPVYLPLLQANQGYFERAALAMLGNRADAEDAVQEAAYLGLRAYHQLTGGEAAFRPWFRQILLRECLRILKRRGRLLPVADLAVHLPETAPGPDPAATEAWEAVGRLADHLRPVIVMRYMLDLSQEEIAAQLGIPLGTVKSRIGKGLALLRTMTLDSERSESAHG
jgi:RNA polymerase sigma factor (sigma-70 family)